jgi:hypothetical protein
LKAILACALDCKLVTLQGSLMLDLGLLCPGHCQSAPGLLLAVEDCDCLAGLDAVAYGDQDPLNPGPGSRPDSDQTSGRF